MPPDTRATFATDTGNIPDVEETYSPECSELLNVPAKEHNESSEENEQPTRASLTPIQFGVTQDRVSESA